MTFHEAFRVRLVDAAHRPDNFDYAVEHVIRTRLVYAVEAGIDFTLTDWRVEKDGPDIVVRGGVDV